MNCLRCRRSKSEHVEVEIDGEMFLCCKDSDGCTTGFFYKDPIVHGKIYHVPAKPKGGL